MAKLENLKELAQAVNRNKVKNIHVVGNNNQSSTVFDEFYQALIDEKFNTDEEYAQYFYNDSPSNKAYYKLKDRLNDRLINTLFFIDINKKGQTKIQKAYYQCYKNLYSIKILIGKNIRNSAITLAKKTIKDSLKYGFTDVNIEISLSLKNHYSTVELNKAEFNRYRKILNESCKIYKKEIKIQDYISLILLHHDKRVVIDKQLKSKFKKRLKKIKKWFAQYYSYKIYLYTFLYTFFYYELNCSWKKLIKESDNCLKYFKEHPDLFSPSFEGLVLSRKLVGLVTLKRYQLANETIQYSLKKFPLGWHNWLFVLDWKIRLNFQSQRYGNIEPILEEVYINKNDFLFFKRWEETFNLHKAFLHYLAISGKVKLNKEKNTFRLQKFLNEVPIQSKDKKGGNVTILVLQILFLLEARKYDAIIDRSESLKVYAHRYLNEEGTYRSNCFVKMLLCLPSANFERKAVEKKGKKYLERLHAKPIEKAKQSPELEIIPYETLWEFVLESLDHP
ncbi:hypothetical protein [Flavilitoribacter nigricans]|uniref:Uncharacterized protein n=1 Tax=Flavilitoribacter nigricans (strain ATCC 23147 / DSM 23189 / NBRC 102662 / NCIMB 1420 / SS-2) TaxID=1122177 RepID=A0A2D0MYY9_FLAN2|nr:hypothetical protein [Flavilitoribacter nigricans]PHN00673.1 hypothetical protein CRP01_41035 [Flavilitoribacter nigricans DSM 23189 = NBRC 102662]